MGNVDGNLSPLAFHGTVCTQKKQSKVGYLSGPPKGASVRGASRDFIGCAINFDGT